MNTKLISALFVASVSVAPAFAGSDIPPPPIAITAQSSGLTRAQVEKEIIQFEQCGYRVGDGAATDYPVEIQAAEVCVASKNSARS